jgi:hypothetical protein
VSSVIVLMTLSAVNVDRAVENPLGMRLPFAVRGVTTSVAGVPSGLSVS